MTRAHAVTLEDSNRNMYKNMYNCAIGEVKATETSFVDERERLLKESFASSKGDSASGNLGPQCRAFPRLVGRLLWAREVSCAPKRLLCISPTHTYLQICVSLLHTHTLSLLMYS